MKQAIIVRQDLKLPKGKLAVQAAHASVEAVFNSTADKVREWREEGMAKILVKVEDEDALLECLRRAKSLGIKTALIKDAGKTVVARGTKTCLGLGPDDDEAINRIIGDLKLI